MVLDSVLGELMSKTHCYSCGKVKTPNMSYSDYRIGPSMFFCKDLYKDVMGFELEGDFDEMMRKYWLGGPDTWQNTTY